MYGNGVQEEQLWSYDFLKREGRRKGRLKRNFD
jgi:hypothetical protein